MDCLIQRFDAEADDDLMFCPHRGVAYQRNMGRGRVAYDAGYFQHFADYAGSATERALNAGRCALLARHASAAEPVLDVGVGSGAFVRAALAEGFDAAGCDINPVAVSWLEAQGLYRDDVGAHGAITLWDSLEHMEDPHLFLRNVRRGAVVCVALPIVEGLDQVRASKHYKPGEHLYYFTDDGFVGWMALHGFRLLERSAHEVEAGRESIGAYAFCRDLPGYDEHVAQYELLHESRHYGASASELYLGIVAPLVKQLAPRSILDYGCGRSDLVAHFWRDGEREIARYDPAIRTLRRLPARRFDLALCCDVLEHVPMAGVDRVLAEIRGASDRAFFAISLKLARARLPDGRNAHVTLLTRSEWMRWVKSVFGKVREIGSRMEGELLLAAGRGV